MVEREDNLYVAVCPERDIGDAFRSGAWVNCAVLSGRDVCRILEKLGFAEVRRRGSHIVMQRRVEAVPPFPFRITRNSKLVLCVP